MYKYLLIILWCCPLMVFAQSTITGKVINLYDKKPVAKASVFLSNTTVGTTTADDGSYTLSNVRLGQYDLVITAIGYENAHQTIQVNGNLTIPFTELNPKTIDLKAVEVKPDPEWERNYKIFKEEFLGITPYADQCKILNPEVINLEFDAKANTLRGSSNDYIEIENWAFGYKIKYLLNEFTRDFSEGFYFCQGNVLFQNMKGTPRQQKKWLKNRLDAYLGSSEHYLRSALTRSYETEGFRTLTLMRKPNPERPADSIIKAKLRQFRSKLTSGGGIVISSNDSVGYWAAKNRLPKTVDYLINKPVKVDSLLKRTDQPGLFALGYQDILYVIYTKKKDDGSYKNRPLNAPDNLTSLMVLKEPYIFFDHNGVIANTNGVIYEGNWARDRVAKMLPVDYDPAEGSKK